jgi:hypothetical protein
MYHIERLPTLLLLSVPCFSSESFFGFGRKLSNNDDITVNIDVTSVVYLTSGCSYDGTYERREGKLIEDKYSFKNKDKGVYLYYSGRGLYGNGLWRLSANKDTTLQSEDACALHLQRSGSIVEESMDPPLGTFSLGWQAPNPNIIAKVDYVLTCNAFDNGTRVACPDTVISGSQPLMGTYGHLVALLLAVTAAAVLA